MSTNEDLPREAREGPIFHPDWGTHAYERYSGNIRGLDALMAMVFLMEGDTIRSEKYLRARRLRIETALSGPWAINVQYTMLSWQVAMRVAAVEAYLQDALTFLGVYDPEFIRDRGSKQEWDYDAIRIASDNEDTLWTFCNNWARAFVGDGGPQRWAKALERSGLGRFVADDVSSLEAMWGYRHMRVHQGGQLTREFTQRHRAEAERIWRDGLQRSDVDEWSAAAGRFVDSAETGISGRLRARLGPELIEQRQSVEGERQMEYWRKRHEHVMTEEPEEARNARIARAMKDAEEKSELIEELFAEGPGESGGTEPRTAP